MKYNNDGCHTLELSTEEVLEIWKMLKEHESELNQHQYVLYKKAEKVIYAVFSVSELEAYGGISMNSKGKQ